MDSVEVISRLFQGWTNLGCRCRLATFQPLGTLAGTTDDDEVGPNPRRNMTRGDHLTMFQLSIRIDGTELPENPRRKLTRGDHRMTFQAIGATWITTGPARSPPS